MKSIKQNIYQYFMWFINNAVKVQIPYTVVVEG
jgi:hypothetical protein